MLGALNYFNWLKIWHKVAPLYKLQYLWKWSQTISNAIFKAIFCPFATRLVNFWANDAIFAPRPLHYNKFLRSKFQAQQATTTL